MSSETRLRAGISDVETLVNVIVQDMPGLKFGVTQYRQVAPDDNGMLRWPTGSRKYADFQELSIYGMGRLGTVGDGNCLLHSLLTLMSPTYRSHNGPSRSKIADAFRNVLKAREERLRDLADAAFAEVGGAAALEESFEILREDREEINIELAPLIGSLYGVNLLAVQINEDMTLRPVCASWKSFDPTRPTILVNYLGGGLDFGNVGFVEGGHYEAILAPSVVVLEAPAGADPKRRTTRKASSKAKTEAKEPIVSLNEVATEYVFQPGDARLAPILEMFATGCREEMSAEAAALIAEIAARNAAGAAALHRVASSGSSSGKRKTHKRRSGSGNSYKSRA
jgi:hypothetical protein